MSRSTPTAYRSTRVGTLRAEDVGERVRLAGWVHRRRDLGGLVFVDLRDRSGLVQLSFGPEWSEPAAHERAGRLGAETVIAVEGEVARRPEGGANADLPTGEVEVRVASLEVLGAAETPPIPVALGAGDELPAEELRLRHRYLDLRREELQRSLGVRHRAQQVVRSWLDAQGFWEIETPMLTRRTPEGARDYLVPSRVHPGEFYALPQSPQLYKQLLMVAGYDRYFQIARCLRDEDLRADRQPEFTQIDAEMSFVDEEDVFATGEGLVAALWKDILDVELETPFPRLSYREAMERYGTDKPDLRIPLEIQDLTDLLSKADFRIFQGVGESGARIRGMRVPGGAALSRKELDQLTEVARAAGAAGALYVKRGPDGLAGPFAKGLDEGLTAAFLKATELAEGDLFVVVVGRFRSHPVTAESHGGTAHHHVQGAEAALDALRRHLAGRLDLYAAGHRWAWVTEFPLFDWDVDGDRLVAAHHPFTAPHPGDVATLARYAGEETLSPEGARALYAEGLRSRAYDAVYNGSEMASGSIRIHEPGLQRQVFRALGIGPEEAQRKFGFLLEAFRYGAPPHGGFAFGFDRLVMLL
ncbi:MAG TPA: aspartate--tRNA ligase, partial [Longimicrobiales bacterium]|nr:aspartate--tRNA ligase [Longimicrobiales bacterium]